MSAALTRNSADSVGSFVKPVAKSSEYGPEAWRRFGSLTEASLACLLVFSHADRLAGS